MKRDGEDKAPVFGSRDFFLKEHLFILCIRVYCSCLQIPEEGIRSHDKRLQPPCGYWESNSGPLERAVGALTTETSLIIINDGHT